MKHNIPVSATPQITLQQWLTLSAHISFITAIIFLFLSPISTQTPVGNITVNSFLTATNNSSAWVSPSQDFAFGFHQVPNDSNLFLLAIWYYKLTDTIVWHANEGKPVQTGSTVTLTADAGLVLKDHQGTHLWDTSSQWNGTFVVSYGFMKDTGNFVVFSNNNTSIWESFQHPTDTLLPSQIMEKGGELNSRVSETNYTKGRFQLRLQNDGNLVLNTKDRATGFPNSPYYTSGTYQPPNQGFRLICNESGHMYLEAENGTKLTGFVPNNRLVSSPSRYYERATLDFYGSWRWYYHLKDSTTNNDTDWSMMTSLPDNICDSTIDGNNSVACGFNSICDYDNNLQRPTCSCPSNYSLLDINDKQGGCKPDFKLQFCDEQDALMGGYKLVAVPNTDWPHCDYMQLNGCSEEQCKSSCHNDCFCAAAVYDAGGAGTCWKKKLPLSNGRIDSSRVVWLKIPNDTNSIDLVTPKDHPGKGKNKVNNVITILLGSSVFFNFALLTAIILGIFLFYNKNPHELKPLEESGNVHCFSYQALDEATDGFSQELGRGAFGVVYKGVITAGKTRNFVAVKKLDRISDDTDKEFKTEVNVIGKTHHKNLVHLVGYCKEQDQRLLVYEYMSNGTLADYLFGDLRPSWIDRVQIAQGIAKGLLYLHEECSTQIIHCDIKPQNILLDEYHRISDFGLAKLLVFNQSHTNTVIRGTKGYVAPEWFRNKPITVKVDVYSFGIALDCYRSNILASLVNDDMEALEDGLRLKRFLMVALWCVQENPSLRPTMRMVTQIFDGLADVPEPPCPASFSVTNI
ncbi:G-type lectin S-receptor-like serine/threonine-protein kinase LECRK3 [Bienertia sinuspersici]